MKYSVKENVRILVSLLKAYGIQHIVLSSGNRNIPFIHLVESDEYFQCYSIVDERSAGFFAIGLIERLQVPVAICCTSGTAVCNYTSAVAEAFYQRLPLVVLTADRLEYFLEQNEDQMVPQLNILKSVTKMSVQLPPVKDDRDAWYCRNRVHSALLEIDHHGKGPVHINFQIADEATNVSDSLYEKPDKLAPMCRYELGIKKQSLWENKIQELVNSKVMILYGQNGFVSDTETNLLNTFTEKYNCIIVKDHMANLHCKNAVNIYTALNVLEETELDKLFPDIIISMGGNSVIVQPLKAAIANQNHQVKQWIVSEDGFVRDSLRCLSDIFECTSDEFLLYYCKVDIIGNNTYAKQWHEVVERIDLPQPKYSSLYAVKRLMENLPDNSIFHIANSSSIRYASMFPLKDNITVYCNRGTNGIDGSFSAFMGNAIVSNELCFLLIGDLSFFYDMNACWNRYSGNNIRILLNNNEGAELFHFSYGKKISKINEYIAAEHQSTAEGWMNSRGYRYLCAHNLHEFEEMLPVFLSDKSDMPIIFEVLTDKANDAKVVHNFYEQNKSLTLKHETKKIVKKIMEKNKTLDVAINKARKKY